MVRIGIWVFIFSLVFACGKGGSNACKSDRDCDGDSVCVNGACRIGNQAHDSGFQRNADEGSDRDSEIERNDVVSTVTGGLQAAGIGGDDAVSGAIGNGGVGGSGISGNQDSGVTHAECGSDYDCEGERVCEEGKCVNPAESDMDAGMDSGKDADAETTDGTGGNEETGGAGGASGAGGTAGVDASAGDTGVGDTGVEGGTAGIDGSIGDTGVEGGTAGVDGSIGDTGVEGGTAGVDGSIGDTGVEGGTAGVDGSIGDTGVEGGTAGVDGSTGDTGVEGGTAGVDGSIGDTGVESGTAGTDGSAGTDGGTATCCPDGNCLCHGPDPTELTSDNGPYDWDSYELQGIGCVYYPTDADPPFAAVAVADGFMGMGGCDSVQTGDWGPFYASYGIVSMVVETGSSDLPSQRADALLEGIAGFKAENENSASPLFEKLAGRYGTSGFSMGGGGTTYAATADSTLLTSVALMAWGPVGEDVAVPTLFTCGSSDVLAPCSTHGMPAYNEMPDSTPKMIVMFSSSHLGQPSAGGGMQGAWALAFQKVFLEGDERWRPILLAGDYEDTNIQ